MLMLMLQTEKGNRILHIASRFGSVRIVTAILLRSDNVNVHNVDGDTPLHYSIKHRHLYIMQTLLRFGADINCA